jgi:hypothetical protein
MREAEWAAMKWKMETTERCVNAGHGTDEEEARIKGNGGGRTRENKDRRLRITALPCPSTAPTTVRTKTVAYSARATPARILTIDDRSSTQ